jgi:RND family efflux transporter MFP subunit
MLKQAEAAFHVAQKDFDRYTSLYKQNSASAKELEQITMQYQSAKAGVEAAKGLQHEVKSQLTYANVVAPFSGVVTQKLADEGSLANPGMPIVTIEQGGSLQVTATVPETEIASLKIGDVANVNVDAANKQFKSKLIQINPSSQFTGGQYIIKLNIPAVDAKQLLAGMYANVKIQANGASGKVDSSNTVMIPTTALIYRDQLVGVYTISAQNTAMLRWLRVGKTEGDKVEVLSGLAKNEAYIIKADGNLHNGAKVSVK